MDPRSADRRPPERRDRRRHPLGLREREDPPFGGSRGYAAFGNPTFGVARRRQADPGARGARRLLDEHPDAAFASTNTTFDTARVHLPRRLVTGILRLYRQDPETSGCDFPSASRSHFADYFYYRGDLTPVIAIPVGEDPECRSAPGAPGARRRDRGARAHMASAGAGRPPVRVRADGQDRRHDGPVLQE